MIVKYSSLNRMETPKFTLCNPGSVYKNGLLSKVIGTLIDTEAEEIVFNFNATSECNFRVNQIVREDTEDNAHTDYLYKSIQNRRLIFVEDIGYFMITGVDDGYDGGKHYKDIKAQSIDVEIAQKMVPSIPDGTYRFQTDATNGNKGILETIVETLPLWTIGEVDETVAEKWRTFEDVDTSLNCLSFLLQNVQDAYECIVVFDIIERTISVYAQDNYVRQTDIHITKDDLINSLEISENADDLYTAVSVIGDDNVTISAINPLGTNVIYDFSYYVGWMSADLGEKVVTWQSAVEAERKPYYDLNLQYYSKMSEESELQAEIDRLSTQITTYTRCRENIVATSSTNAVSGYNDVIADSGGTKIDIGKEIADTLSQIDNLVSQCDSQKASVAANLVSVQKELGTYKEQIEQVHHRLSITTYFTEAEYAELCHYIFEGSYTDEYVIITDIMTYDEKFEQMKTLYDRAVSQLERVSKPTQEFSVDVENFIFIKDFEKWSEQLETGCLINVELGVNDIALLFLSNITINYDDHSLNMTFGNRFNKFDPKSLFNDVLGKISKSANTLGYIKNLVYPIKSGEFSEMQEALQTSRDLTMRAALASTNEEVVIDNTGYTGKRILSNGEYDPRQVKLVCNSMVFTDDAWDSCEVAVGEILLGDGDSVYGVNAEAIMGKIIIGEHLAINNESGNLSFDNDGFEITNGTNSFVVSPNSDTLLSIAKDKEKIFYVDDKGKLHITGDGSGLDISTNDSITQVVERTKHYGTCTTAAGTAAKAVTCEGFALYTGASISVKFTNKNSVASPTLNVNSTGAKQIRAYGSALTADSSYNWSAGAVVSFVYDGTHWVMSDSGALYQTSQIKQTADEISLTVASKVGSNEIISKINQSSEEVSISADKISLEGVVTANETFKILTNGSIQATGGTIGGWTITKNKLFAGDGTDGNRVVCVQAPSENTSFVFAAGGTTHTTYSDCPFRVTKTGALYATNAVITGSITATSGTIGGCSIVDNALQIKNVNIIEKLTADRIDATDLQVSAANVTGTLTAASISAARITAGTNNAAITFEGAIVAKNITANTAGEIAGWTLNSYKLSKGNFGSTNYIGIYSKFPAGSDGTLDADGNSGTTHAQIGNVLSDSWRIIAGKNFGVTKDGQLSASNVNISGIVNAEEGQFGPWKIGSFTVGSVTTPGISASDSYGTVYITSYGVQYYPKGEDASMYKTWKQLLSN